MKKLIYYATFLIAIGSCTEKIVEPEKLNFDESLQEYMAENGYNFITRNDSLVLKWHEDFSIDHFTTAASGFFSQRLKRTLNTKMLEQKMNQAFNKNITNKRGSDDMSCGGSGGSQVCCWSDSDQEGHVIWCFDYKNNELYIYAII